MRRGTAAEGDAPAWGGGNAVDELVSGVFCLLRNADASQLRGGAQVGDGRRQADQRNVIGKVVVRGAEVWVSDELLDGQRLAGRLERPGGGEVVASWEEKLKIENMIRDFESSFMGGKSSFFTNNNGGPNAAHNDAAVGGGDDPPVVENGGAAVVRQPTLGGLVRLKGGHPGISANVVIETV